MTQDHLEDRLADELASLAEAGLTRRRRLLETPCSPHLRVDGREMLAFASNDYLGLAAHPEVAAALAEGARRWGAGSGASALVSGHLAPHEALEAQLAAFVGFPRSLAFSTGYLANLAVVPTLARRDAAIFSDRLNHASLIDAAQLAKAQGAISRRYPHGDLAALARLLAATPARTRLIVTDAVFSMDGDLAPLPALLELARQYDAWLVVDDAHGLGVLGPQGKGSLAHFGLAFHPRLILMGTLGKAAGVAGAFVAGSERLIEVLIQRARSYVFTTAPPPAVACALAKSLEILANDAPRRTHLLALIAQLREGLIGLPWRPLPSMTAIQPLVVGGNQETLDLAAALWDKGLWVPAIRPPTVPRGTARLRISLSAAHSRDDVEHLIAALRECA